MVQAGIYDEFVKRATARAKRRSVGDPFSAGVEQGPQVDSDQFNTVMGYIQAGVAEGACLQVCTVKLHSLESRNLPEYFLSVARLISSCRDWLIFFRSSILSVYVH